MSSYTVAEGDSLISIAAAHELKDWRTIYYDPANESFRAKRPDPMLLVPGDTLTIPDDTAAELNCTVGQSYTFQLHALEPVSLRLSMPDAGDVPFVLKSEDGEELAKGTIEKGLIDVEVPGTFSKGELRLWEDDEENETVVLTLEAGLQPASEEDGAKARLNNLGYLIGDSSDEAVAAFQRDNALEPTGELNEATTLLLGHLHP